MVLTQHWQPNYILEVNCTNTEKMQSFATLIACVIITVQYTVNNFLITQIFKGKNYTKQQHTS